MGLLLPQLSAAARPERPFASFAIAAAAHAIALALLAIMVPARQIERALQPMTVRLLELLPEQAKAPPPRPPRAKLPRPSAPPLLISSAPAAAPAAYMVAAPTPAPVSAPLDALPAPAPAPAPPAITAARFDADYLDNPKPVYPHASRRMGEQGKVLLRVFVSAAGLAEKVEIKLSSGFARLDQAAHEAVNRWRFVPARRGDQAIAAWVQVPVTFQLES